MISATTFWSLLLVGLTGAEVAQASKILESWKAARVEEGTATNCTTVPHQELFFGEVQAVCTARGQLRLSGHRCRCE